MTEIDAASIKLDSAFNACNKHLERMLYAKKQLSANAPFSAAFLASATPEQIASMDQFVFRFGRLQDTMGAQVFPAVLQLTGEYKPESTFIDRLNALEKFGAINSAKEWQAARYTRNKLSHDYPELVEILAETLNEAMPQALKLEQTLKQIQAFASRYQ